MVDLIVPLKLLHREQSGAGAAEISSQNQNNISRTSTGLTTYCRGILSQGRDGQERFFPIMTLSIGVVIPNAHNQITHDEVANMASQAKHHAKTMSGNSLYV